MLILIRHGEAVPPTVDPDQPLSPAGQSAVRRLATVLEGMDLSAFYHSPKTRARQTATLLQQHLRPAALLQERAGLAPYDDPGLLLSDIARWTRSSVICSHLPFLSRLLCRLLGHDQETPLVIFYPATAVVLEQGPEGRWLIRAVIPPG